eukprot:1151282-Alexandrium_andersonii.AAC.1
MKDYRAQFNSDCIADQNSQFNLKRKHSGLDPVPPMCKGMYTFPETILEVFLTGRRQNSEMEEAQRLIGGEEGKVVPRSALAESTVLPTSSGDDRMQEEAVPMCTWQGTAREGVEARVVKLESGEVVSALGAEQDISEPTFALPVVRTTDLAQLAGPASGAEAGARVCARLGESAREVRELLDPVARRTQYGHCEDPGQGDRLDPAEVRRREEILARIKAEDEGTEPVPEGGRATAGLGSADRPPPPPAGWVGA